MDLTGYGYRKVSREEFIEYLDQYSTNKGRMMQTTYMGWYMWHDAETGAEVGRLYEEYGPGEYWIKG